MFGKKGKSVSTKQRLSKVFRLISCSGEESSNVSFPTPVFKVAPCEAAKPPLNHSLTPAEPKTFNVQAYTTAKRRMHEIESQKAMLLLLSRHERWKAGGPV